MTLKETNTERMDEEQKNKFLKNDNKAKSLIVQCVSNSILEYLREKRSAYKMWEILEQRFEKKGLPKQLFLKRKMLSMKLKEGDSLEKFIGEFEKILRQLKATGINTDEQDIICNLLMALPKSYETVVTIIENMPRVTYHNVKIKLIAENEKRKGKTKKKV
ncbi:hypothetical protein JTB14_011120 [Gonioctena quinquepunctata]|nr:hypothetical protein JTB14_011120 [Gonioctena quinquepunctata]